MEKLRKPFSIEHYTMPSGNKFHTNYEVAIDEHGHKTLAESGSTNTYAMIQEHLEETLIENILRRAELGDEEALNRVNGQYLDTTDMPKSLAEAQNKIIAIKNEFEKLPIELRRQFDFSPEKYIQEYGTEPWMKTMGFIKDPEPETKTEKKEEVVTNE